MLNGLFPAAYFVVPVAEPRLHIHVVSLQPHPAVVEQAVVITQIHTDLHDPVPAVQAGGSPALGTVTLFAVKPLSVKRIFQFGALAGKGNKVYFAVAKIEMIELTQEEIAQAVGFKALRVIPARDRRCVKN